MFSPRRPNCRHRSTRRYGPYVEMSDGLLAAPRLSIGTGLVRACASPCGRFLATTGGTEVRLWDSTSGRSLGANLPMGDWGNEVHFSFESKMVITASEDGSTYIWNCLIRAVDPSSHCSDWPIWSQATRPAWETV